MSPPLPRRSGDPGSLDPRALRHEPIAITVSRTELADAITAGRTRAFTVGLITAIITSIVVSAVAGLFITSRVTSTVSRDVGRAAVFNCNRTNRAATVGPALKAFLTTDARFNAQLGALDMESARIDRDLSQKLKPFPLPPSIAKDYFAQSSVFQHLAAKRAQVANLWAGPADRDGTRSPSLAQDILTIARVQCDQLLLP